MSLPAPHSMDEKFMRSRRGAAINPREVHMRKRRELIVIVFLFTLLGLIQPALGKDYPVASTGITRVM